VKHVLRTGSAESTRAVAATLARLARPGDLLLLAGELGAGKTAFAQGFGLGLGVKEPITSPTFVLARDYDDGRIPLHHLDVYRLDQMNEVFDIGLPEVLDDGGVTLIEWGDAIMPSLPANYLEVRLTFGEGDDERVIVVRPVGPGWATRSSVLERALAEWVLPLTGPAEAAGC
jgi:tRNA threonylcarbamoyladenosine biosynthesis protein TsaE